MRTFVNFKCEDPKLWLQDYNENGMPELEYFTGLVSCAKSASAASIMECVSEEQFQEFKAYILEMADVQNDSDFISIGNPERVFGVKEVRKLVEWFSQES